MSNPFFNLYSHGFARVAVGVPECKVADPAFNAAQTIALAQQAAQGGAVLVAFPELGLSAYTCDDLFHQKALLDACEAALDQVARATAELDIAVIVGAPLRVAHQLYNCAVVIAGGRILGVVPKSFLPNYSEFYEARQFSAADCAVATEIRLLDQTVPFGPELLFQMEKLPLFQFHVEICEDVWVPIPPSSFAALAGATVLVNLSASNIVVGKSAYRHQLVAQQSARCLAAYMYTSAGRGESSTDLAWDGQALIYENGELLGESERFLNESHLLFADVDLERLSRERMHQTTFGQSARRHRDEVRKFRQVLVPVAAPLEDAELPLERRVARFPYVPADPRRRDERCKEVYNIQVQALAQRLSASGMSKVVIGISGGLDSTHALLVCAQAMDTLGLPRANILAVTMPGFATSTRTLQQARQLMAVVGCTASEVDIRPSCLQMLKDLGHPYADGKPVYDITFENVQAGERTNHLFRIANFNNAIVIGTGDLSELALGWCTYGVGDHMSHYSVNASVPKTLITHLVRWVAESGRLGEAGAAVLLDVLGTDVSPELVPGGDDGKPTQKSEDTIGPYELQDFNLYYTLRYGFAPTKVAFLALAAWRDRDAGAWPEGGHVARNQYDLAAIKRNLKIFLDRFFRLSQFKRTCVPNAPKVGSGGSLSPRGDWRAPSDSESVVWMRDADRIPDQTPPA
ncbi:NAD(+) synthase [Achromobacter xylosoxidans]|uniref:NAD(+) synthase n=1 Tax=Alcaligenes xylosoxydans xylosoxydans TaxID=85698 RepID=UPI00047BADA5|nr:NAD(+) synthase [Achromobacter xylosoxidans]KAA5924586.1 NAD(+) synthase [Achromobacter xylosoxidans]MBK1979529.1 NAD(+) synthase [Achromobacter xylosoxidans]MCH4595738.1 NAD(+) synthase [Achromobacter xylosoxidans]MCM2570780.1 NAD(+) synthase [Achromobacter xylosoxidans]MCZ8385086.1 NAD(+) synthase [Achromobacter xylosoxidans]